MLIELVKKHLYNSQKKKKKKAHDDFIIITFKRDRLVKKRRRLELRKNILFSQKSMLFQGHSEY